MYQLFARILRLQPGETNHVLVLSLILMSNALARQISDVVAISGFLSEVGVNQLLFVWLIDMLLIILVTALQSLIVDRFNRVHLMGWMMLIYAVLLVCLRVMFALNMPGIISYSLLYLLAEQQLIFFPLVFWIMANDILSMVQSRRLFPVIATGGFVGQILGLVITAASSGLMLRTGLVSEDLLLLNAAIYLGAYLLTRAALRAHTTRRRPPRIETLREQLTEGWGFVRQVPSFRYLMLAMIAVNICLTINEFHFLVVSGAVFPTTEEYQRFYSLVRLVLTVAAFAVQGLLTSRIIDKISLKNAFFILPASLLSGAAAMMTMPNLVGGAGGFALGKIAQQTIDESARKSFQALVPEERRGRVSMFMDSYLFAAGTILGCLITGGIVLASPHYLWDTSASLYLPVSVLCALAAIGLIARMRTVYDSSLFNWRLKRRQRKSSVFDKL